MVALRIFCTEWEYSLLMLRLSLDWFRSCLRKPVPPYCAFLIDSHRVFLYFGANRLSFSTTRCGELGVVADWW